MWPHLLSGFASQVLSRRAVAVGRGIVPALIKYVNAVHGLELVTPFTKLAAVGLMPDRAKPRARVLQIDELPAWKAAVDQLGQRQRDYLYLTLFTGLRRNERREATAPAD